MWNAKGKPLHIINVFLFSPERFSVYSHVILLVYWHHIVSYCHQGSESGCQGNLKAVLQYIASHSWWMRKKCHITYLTQSFTPVSCNFLNNLLLASHYWTPYYIYPISRIKCIKRWQTLLIHCIILFRELWSRAAWSTERESFVMILQAFPVPRGLRSLTLVFSTKKFKNKNPLQQNYKQQSTFSTSVRYSSVNIFIKCLLPQTHPLITSSLVSIWIGIVGETTSL